MITFRKEPAVTGLASVGAGPRGYDLVDNKEIVAKVAPITRGRYEVTGWYFYTLNGHGYNSLSEGGRFDMLDEAKSACKKFYVSGETK